MNHTIGPCTRAEMAAVTAIYRAEVLGGVATFEIDAPSEDEMARRLSDVTGAGYPWLVATRGGSVVGYAYADAFRGRPAFAWTVEDSLYVAPAARGGGIGRALLDALVIECARRGFRQMVAVIGDSANAASIRVHAAAGFAPVGVHPALGWKLGRWVDVVTMQRALGAAAAMPP